MSKRQHESGYILVMALLVAAILLSLSTGAAFAARAGATIGHQSADESRAYYLAQAGLEDVTNYLTIGNSLPSGTSTYGPYSLGGGSYSVQVTNSNGNYTFAVSASYDGKTRIISGSGSTSGAAVVTVYGTADDTFDSVYIGGVVNNGKAVPFTLSKNGKLNFNKYSIGGVYSGTEVDATVLATKEFDLADSHYLQGSQWGCTGSGSPLYSSNRASLLYGSINACATFPTYSATNYSTLKSQAQAGISNSTGYYTTACPAKGSSALTLTQPASPNPYQNFVYFVDCSGYNGSQGNTLEIATDTTGLNGTFTLVVWGNGNNKLNGLQIDRFIAQGSSHLAIISDVPNPLINQTTVSACLKFDATTGKLNIQNGSTVNGSIMTYDMNLSGGTNYINVYPCSYAGTGTSNTFTFSQWSN